MSTITNSAMGVGITLTAGIELRRAALYLVLRIIDGAASYYMSSIGHIMGVHIETDMRRDAFAPPPPRAGAPAPASTHRRDLPSERPADY